MRTWRFRLLWPSRRISPAPSLATYYLFLRTTQVRIRLEELLWFASVWHLPTSPSHYCYCWFSTSATTVPAIFVWQFLFPGLRYPEAQSGNKLLTCQRPLFSPFHIVFRCLTTQHEACQSCTSSITACRRWALREAGHRLTGGHSLSLTTTCCAYRYF